MTDLTYPIKVLEDSLKDEVERRRVATFWTQPGNRKRIGEERREEWKATRDEAKERIPQLEAAIKLLKESNHE